MLMEGLSYTDCAKAFGVTVTGIRNAIARNGLESLKKPALRNGDVDARSDPLDGLSDKARRLQIFHLFEDFRLINKLAKPTNYGEMKTRGDVLRSCLDRCKVLFGWDKAALSAGGNTFNFAVLRDGLPSQPATKPAKVPKPPTNPPKA